MALQVQRIPSPRVGTALLQWATTGYVIQFKALYPRHEHKKFIGGEDLIICVCGYTIEWKLIE